jgi:hypothetical protein
LIKTRSTGNSGITNSAGRYRAIASRFASRIGIGAATSRGAPHSWDWEGARLRVAADTQTQRRKTAQGGNPAHCETSTTCA